MTHISEAEHANAERVLASLQIDKEHIPFIIGQMECVARHSLTGSAIWVKAGSFTIYRVSVDFLKSKEMVRVLVVDKDGIGISSSEYNVVGDKA